MKAITLVLIWFIVVFLALLTLYKLVTPEAQYAMAEHFGIYGDELIMDFVLYVFFATAIFLASLVTYCAFLITKNQVKRVGLGGFNTFFRSNDGHTTIKSSGHDTGILMSANKHALRWIAETMMLFVIYTLLCYFLPDVFLYHLYTRNFGFVTELDWNDNYTTILFILSFIINALIIYTRALYKQK